MSEASTDVKAEQPSAGTDLEARITAHMRLPAMEEANLIIAALQSRIAYLERHLNAEQAIHHNCDRTLTTSGIRERAMREENDRLRARTGRVFGPVNGCKHDAAMGCKDCMFVAPPNYATALTSAQERIEKMGRGSLPCDKCGLPVVFEFTVASSYWNRFVRSLGIGEYLCFWCFDSICAKAGRIERIPVGVNLAGEVAVSEWCGDDVPGAYDEESKQARLDAALAAKEKAEAQACHLRGMILNSGAQGSSIILRDALREPTSQCFHAAEAERLKARIQELEQIIAAEVAGVANAEISQLNRTIANQRESIRATETRICELEAELEAAKLAGDGVVGELKLLAKDRAKLRKAIEEAHGAECSLWCERSTFPIGHSAVCKILSAAIGDAK